LLTRFPLCFSGLKSNSLDCPFPSFEGYGYCEVKIKVILLYQCDSRRSVFYATMSSSTIVVTRALLIRLFWADTDIFNGR